MFLVETMLGKEKKRNELMTQKYKEELAALPKGKVVPKIQNGRTYYYLKFRDGDKICAIYLGKDESATFEVTEKLERRKSVEIILKELKDERQKIQRLEARI